MPTRTTATTVEGSTRLACESFKPISYSAKLDTPETVKEIREHNAAYDYLCQKK